MTLFEEAAPTGAVRRVVLGVAYDGASFRGFAAQPGQRTVASALCGALEKITGSAVRATCAGRTDAGVHALAQVVHVDLPEDFLLGRLGASGIPGEPLASLARSLSGIVGPDCVVWDAAIAPEGFDARRSARARRYHYDLDLGQFPEPLRRFAAWHVEEPLDLKAMRLATDPLIGEHDFAGFCRRPPGTEPGPIRRRVTDASWRVLAPSRLRFVIEAQSFCHQMVRSIVGTLVAVGAGKARPSDVVARLASGSRTGAPTLAPPRGLCLVEVDYPEPLGGRRRFPGTVPDVAGCPGGQNWLS